MGGDATTFVIWHIQLRTEAYLRPCLIFKATLKGVGWLELSRLGGVRGLTDAVVGIGYQRIRIALAPNTLLTARGRKCACIYKVVRHSVFTTGSEAS